MSWLRNLSGRLRWDGSAGRPRSANAASSFHLVWDAPSRDWIAAEAVLEVTVPPTVDSLYFWAMQVSFSDFGRMAGGAHLGLQWHRPHPGSTAVNWGGYAADGRELTGSTSTLPSATSNPNTRDFVWSAAVRYRLAIERVAATGPSTIGSWRGSVTNLQTGDTTVVRDLFAPGSTITAPMVWSEVFADCDAPSAAVRWDELALVSSEGERVAVRSTRVNYQSVGDGGCARTNSTTTSEAFEQRTNVARSTRQDTRLTID